MKNIFSIEDIFTITGRGTVATGRMVSGDVKTGDHLFMPDGNKVLITGIEFNIIYIMLNRIKGDNLGLLLRGVTKEYMNGFRKSQVEVGDISEIRDRKLNELGI